MNRTDNYDQLYCLVADLSEATHDPDLMEAFNLLAVRHRPTRWVDTWHLDRGEKHSAATSLLAVLQSSPTDLREALDLDALADLIGDRR